MFSEVDLLQPMLFLHVFAHVVRGKTFAFDFHRAAHVMPCDALRCVEMPSDVHRVSSLAMSVGNGRRKGADPVAQAGWSFS